MKRLDRSWASNADDAIVLVLVIAIVAALVLAVASQWWSGWMVGMATDAFTMWMHGRRRALRSDSASLKNSRG
jgi:hypothetical protein